MAEDNEDEVTPWTPPANVIYLGTRCVATYDANQEQPWRVLYARDGSLFDAYRTLTQLMHYEFPDTTDIPDDTVVALLALRDVAPTPVRPADDAWIAGEEARLRQRHADSGSTRPYYSGD